MYFWASSIGHHPRATSLSLSTPLLCLRLSVSKDFIEGTFQHLYQACALVLLLYFFVGGFVLSHVRLPCQESAHLVGTPVHVPVRIKHIVSLLYLVLIVRD